MDLTFPNRPIMVRVGRNWFDDCGMVSTDGGISWRKATAETGFNPKYGIDVSVPLRIMRLLYERATKQGIVDLTITPRN